MTIASAYERVREAGGDELAERLRHLDAVRSERASLPTAPRAPGPGDRKDFDVVVAGGGLWSLLPPLLAARGIRVAVVERTRAAQSHREWNASGPELEALVSVGLLERAELERLVIARYKRGICRFAGGGSYPVEGVLDHAVDAQPLLSLARTKAERAGVTFIDGRAALSVAASEYGIRTLLRDPRAANDDSTLTASVLVDARGAASPFATADLVCPTVGGVLGGLENGDAPDQMNPAVGEILATVDGVEEGRQHVWEAFPGRPGETTVYVFYYARTTEPVRLSELYARFFDTLGSYKRGDARLLRPTFGFIPGWSRLSPGPKSPHPRIVLVGDAASRHSPLTYCGFGATLRSLSRAANEIERRVEARSLEAETAVDDAPIHSLTGALAWLMASRGFVRGELNGLLDAAFATLYDLGNDDYAALLRDEMRPKEFTSFLQTTARRHPAVWGKVVRALGPWKAGRWGLGVAQALLRPSP